MVFSTVIRPTYKDTDQMGVVYHGNYFTYFETGRTEMFRQMGYAYKDLESAGVVLPVLECGCKYARPAIYDEEIIVKTRIVELKGIRVRLEYEMLMKSDESLLATGFSTHAFVNKEMKPIRLGKVNEEFLMKVKMAIVE